MPDKSPLSRRRFLKTAAGASALAAVPYFVPASALGKDGAVPPSEQIIVGGIGIRSAACTTSVDHARRRRAFVAICDLQKKQRVAVKEVVDNHYGNKDCAMYPEIRGFLAARPDIDAVLIATGDRWHALASILAMRAGKDVYTEKPSCMTIAEGRAVVETAHRYGRVYQTGTQRLSEANHVFCIEMARTGRLGKIHTAYAHIAPWDAAEMRHDWLPAEERAAQGRGGLGCLAGPLPVAALQPQLRRRRLARRLRLPHELHRRVGGAHLRPGPGRLGLRRARPSSTNTWTTTAATAWSPTSPTA